MELPVVSRPPRAQVCRYIGAADRPQPNARTTKYTKANFRVFRVFRGFESFALIVLKKHNFTTLFCGFKKPGG
jgi:hypothetical protein